jgi:YVTN family beta-propeller protein
MSGCPTTPSNVVWFLLALVGCVACTPSTPPAPARPTPSPALLVLSKRDETLSIVDPSTLEIIARVPVGHDPHEVVNSMDGSLAYVSNYGHGEYNSLAVVDLVTQRARTAIDLGPLRGPHGLAYVDGKVWFTAEGAKVIGSYDPAKAVVDWVLGTGQDRTHMIVVSADTKTIITSNVSSGTLSFLERDVPGPSPHPPGLPAPTRSDWEQTLVAVSSGTEGFDVSSNGRELWAADAQDGSIAIVDVPSRKVVQRLDASIRGANRLKFSPDGKWVLVSTLAGPDLVVFDATTRAEAKRVTLGHGAAGIQIQPDSARAYVACSPDGYVAVVDLRSMTVVGRIQAGADPDGLAWAVRP